MRRWFFLFGLIAVIWLLTVTNSRKAQKRSPFLHRFKETLTILAWTLTAVYVLAFLYLIYISILK